MKLHVWILLTLLSVPICDAGEELFDIHDFYLLEVPQEELALKSIARVVIGAGSANRDRYEENIATNITHLENTLHKPSSNTYTPVSIDFDTISDGLSDQIVTRFNELAAQNEEINPLKGEKLQILNWKIRNILLVQHLSSLVKMYYKLKESGDNVKSCDEIDRDGFFVCISSVNDQAIVYSAIARKDQFRMQNYYSVNRINHEWVLTSIIIDPDMMTEDFFVGLAYLK